MAVRLETEWKDALAGQRRQPILPEFPKADGGIVARFRPTASALLDEPLWQRLSLNLGISRKPPTEAALLPQALLGLFRHLGPVSGQLQPAFLIERVYRPAGLIAAFIS